MKVTNARQKIFQNLWFDPRTNLIFTGEFKIEPIGENRNGKIKWIKNKSYFAHRQRMGHPSGRGAKARKRTGLF